MRTRLTTGEGGVKYRPGTLPWKEKPIRIGNAVLLYREHIVRVDLTKKTGNRSYSSLRGGRWDVTHFLMSWRNVPPAWYNVLYTNISWSQQLHTKYVRLWPSVDISKVMRRKQSTKKKFLTWRFFRVEYMHTSVPSGPCQRHEAWMLPTANSEQQSTPRSRGYSSRYCDCCSRVTIISHRAWPKEENI